jgi:N-acetylmuramoyl-L-alanine amidase
VAGSEAAADAIAKANGSRVLRADSVYRLDFELLAPAMQVAVLRALFPKDQLVPGAWVHSVQRVQGGIAPSLWRIAVWFTGKGDNFKQLRDLNQLSDDQIHADQALRIPAELLRPTLRSALPVAPPAAVVSPTVSPTTAPAAVAVAVPLVVLPAPQPGDGPLEYRRGADGADYAIYRLRPGEALYSAVVVRFTGRIFAEDVNATADQIATFSSITDVTDIPIGYEVKIPFDLLQPEFLPAGHVRRAEYEAGMVAAAVNAPSPTNRLSGVTIVLDAGHGGRDSGATWAGVWESLYVYDIMVRVKQLLEQTTAANVVTTVRDGDRFSIPQRDVLSYSRNHRVLTTPHYPIEDAQVGTNLRWYLANSVHRKAKRAGAPDDRLVFVSIHADSLHPSLRGGMVYVPAAKLTAGRSERSGSAYTARAEVREQPAVEFAYRDRSRSEGLSRRLADQMVKAFGRSGLLVHPHKPVRDRIIRSKSWQYVPAVLRYNSIPTKVLLEVCNLANSEDRALLQTQAFRDTVSRAVVDSLLVFYGESTVPAPAPARAAR